MKSLTIIVLVLATEAAALAQGPRIVGFDIDGTLAWTNSQATGRCGVVWTLDLDYTWLPLSEQLWNLAVTSNYMVVTQMFRSSFVADVSALIQNLSFLFPAIAARKDRAFFRLDWSPADLQDPTITNFVRLENLSDEALSNVEFSVQHGFGSTVLTNLPALSSGGTTEYMVVTEVLSMGSSYIAVPAIFPPLDYFWGWKTRYSVHGTNYQYASSCFPLGPADKKVTVIVSNAVRSLWFEWMGPPITFPEDSQQAPAFYVAPRRK